MIKTFSFVRSAVKPGTLYLTREAQEATGLRCPGFTILAHGARRVEAAVSSIPDEGRILPVSPALADALGLVESIPYRLRSRDGQLVIGPVIGINSAERDQNPELLQPGELRYGFLLQYPDVGGLVYLFGTDGMDFETGTIEGHCWIPGDPDGSVVEADVWTRVRYYGNRVQERAAAEAKPLPPHPRPARFQALADRFMSETPLPEPRGSWHGHAALGCGRFVPGRFPFPAAMWRRSLTLTPAIRTRLIEEMGVSLFNSYFFNKDEAWQILSVDPAIRSHLPATEPLNSFEQLMEWISQNGRALLKPVDSTSGIGMMGVMPEGSGYQLRQRETNQAESFAGVAELRARLEPVTAGERYLLQHWIDLPRYEDRPNDYRVVMQKDERGHWHVAGMLGRFGRKGAMLTNFIQQGYALPGDEALARAFGVSHRDAFLLQEKIARFAVSVCQSLDRTGGLYGDLGLDIAIDRDQQVWLFEVNKRYDMEVPLHAGLEETYLQVKSGPLRYAASLAGFGAE